MIATAGLFEAQAMACTCRPSESAADDFRKASAVFEGTVLNVSAQGFRDKEVRLKVIKSYKGTNNAQELVVSTASMSAACGSQFEVGKNYMVYAYMDNGRLKTNLCTRTKLLLPRAFAPRI